MNQKLFSIFLIAASLLFCSSAKAWYNTSWHYAVPIIVPSGASINSTIVVNVDFAALLTTLGVVGSFDINSPRVVRSDNVTLVTNQEFTDAVYNGVTDATGDSQGEIRFFLQDAGATTYYLYFDITSNGVKAVNPQAKVNGNFEPDSSGTAIPANWSAATRSTGTMDIQVRPNETITVTDTDSGSTVSTNGVPNTGNFAYLIGFRSQTDPGATGTLTRTITIPASNPGNINIRIKPEGWDAGQNGNTSSFDFLQVQLLNSSTSAVLLNIVGPTLSNYTTCPFSPNYSTNQASNNSPGYGDFNGWDNGTSSNNHTLGMASTYSRGAQVWINCSASLASLAGQTVTLQIKINTVTQFKTWFLIDDIEWSVVSATLGIPISNVAVAIPSSFNAFDSSTTANSTSGVIQTKIAGTAFTFDVVALTITTAVLSNFSSAIMVELVDASSSSTCSVMNSIQTVAASYTYTASDSGRHTFSSVTQAQAYPNVKVRVSYPAVSPTKVVCSSDAFAIRPSYFTVAATDASWSTSGASRILNASTTNGTPTHKAGQPLTLTVTPYNSSNVVTSTYSGTPIALASCLLPAASCVAGVFSGGSFILSNGVATSNTASYTDVGVVSLSVSDATFAVVDAADGTSASQLTITSAATSVGRFVPDHFDVVLNTPVFAPSCTTFTYIGQPIKYATNPVATVTAKNAAGVATQNYTSASGLFKISPGNAAYGITPSYAEASQAVSVLNSAVPVSTDSGNGVSTLTFADTSSNILGITRPSSPINAFSANIALSFALQDTDGVMVGNVNGVSAANPVHFGTASSGAGISFTGGYNTQKWGRLAMSNVNGSELTALSVPLFVEYYNGTAFVSNSSDNCTSISLANQISLSNPSTSAGAAQVGTATMTVGSATTSASISPVTLAAGSSSISFSAPGAGNTGYININSNISSLLPWLLYPWNQGGSANTSPAAVATFGVYQGNPNIIYFREVY
jgi:hypothetical protein